MGAMKKYGQSQAEVENFYVYYTRMQLPFEPEDLGAEKEKAKKPEPIATNQEGLST